jgi:hypothetical protein
VVVRGKDTYRNRYDRIKKENRKENGEEILKSGGITGVVNKNRKRKR